MHETAFFQCEFLLFIFSTASFETIIILCAKYVYVLFGVLDEKCGEMVGTMFVVDL